MVDFDKELGGSRLIPLETPVTFSGHCGGEHKTWDVSVRRSSTITVGPPVTVGFQYYSPARSSACRERASVQNEAEPAGRGLVTVALAEVFDPICPY